MVVSCTPSFRLQAPGGQGPVVLILYRPPQCLLQERPGLCPLLLKSPSKHSTRVWWFGFLLFCVVVFSTNYNINTSSLHEILLWVPKLYKGKKKPPDVTVVNIWCIAFSSLPYVHLHGKIYCKWECAVYCMWF